MADKSIEAQMQDMIDREAISQPAFAVLSLCVATGFGRGTSISLPQTARSRSTTPACRAHRATTACAR